MDSWREMRKFLAKILAALSIVLIGGVCLVNTVLADELPETRIQLSPGKLDLDLKPGEVLKTEFRIQNTGSKSFDFELEAAPYTVSNEQYTAIFTEENSYTDIYKWMKLSVTGGTLKSGESKIIEVTITVPKDVPAGGQYGAVLASVVNHGDENGGVAINQRVGILFYANVDGETHKTGSVLENKVDKFLFEPPIKATSVVENTGNTHMTARYALQVFPLFSDEEVYTTEETPQERTVLPDTKLFNTVSWDGAPRLGIFRVRQTVEFGDEKSVVEKIIFLCPIWFLFIIVLLIFCVAFWLISQARGRHLNGNIKEEEND